MKPKILRKDIHIDKITLWFENPRYFDRLNDNIPTNEKEAIIKLFEVVGADKILSIAKDICEDGLNDFELPILVPDYNHKNNYISFEGNRRIACIKCILHPELIATLKIRSKKNIKNVYEMFIGMHRNFKNSIEKNIFSSIKNKEEALRIVNKLHSKKTKPGINRENWSPRSKDEFDFRNNKNSKSTASIITDELKKHLNIDIKEKIHHTNIDRIFNKKKVKDFLGYEYNDLNKEQAEEINQIIDKAISKLGDGEGGISRIFNKQEQVVKFLKDIRKNEVSKKQETLVKNAQKINNDKLKNKEIRITLINVEWANIQISNLGHDLQKIKSLIYHLAQIKFDSNEEINNYSIIALALRALIEHLTFLFQRKLYPNKDLKLIESDSRGLESFVNHARNLMIQNGWLTNTNNKITTNNKHLIHALQGSIHDAKTSLDLNTIKDIFDTHKEYLEVCIEQISSNIK